LNDAYFLQNKENLIANIEFTAFDFETTGLSPNRDRIVEIGAVRFRNGQVYGTYESLINPGIPIPPKVTSIHGITDGMVEDKPSAEDMLPDFLGFIHGSVLVAHNAPFDTRFLFSELKRAGSAPPKAVILDSLPLSRKAFPGRKSYKLQDLAPFFSVPVSNAHRACDDAQVCMKVFSNCIKELEEKKGNIMFSELTDMCRYF